MFEQLEDHAKPEVRGWMIWSTLLGVLSVGIMIGLLLGRRNWDLFQWGQVVLLTLLLWRLALPVFKEFKTFRHLKDQHGS